MHLGGTRALVALALVAAGCGEGDGGLVEGAVDNQAARSLAEGASSREAQEALAAEPLESGPYRGGVRGGTCELYRGVDAAGREDVVVTGVLWRVCLRRGRVAVVERECPAPMRAGELTRYEEAGYRTSPRSCPS